MRGSDDGFLPIACEHEGLALKGRLILPSGPGPHPAVLVVPTAFGLGGHIPAVAERLAAQGYAAVAADMYGDGVFTQDTQEIASLVAPLWGNAARLRARTGAWLDALRSRPEIDAARIAAIGYCFGGQCVLELARGGADLRAVVSFHGILTTEAPAEHGAVRAHIAVHTGARDPHVPPAHVAALHDELIAAGAAWQIAEYGGAYHAFTDPEASTPETGRAYDAVADRQSWASTLALLDAALRS